MTYKSAMYHSIACECDPPPGPLRSPSGNTSKTNDEICFAHFFCLMPPSHSFRDISDSKILKTLKSKALRRAQPSKQSNSPSGHCLRALHCVQQNKQKIKALKVKAPQCLRPSKLQNDPFGSNYRAPHCVRQDKQKHRKTKNKDTFGAKRTIG